MYSFFASYRNYIYWTFRLRQLPSVDHDIIINRSDPLAPDGHFLTDTTSRAQRSTLANALTGGLKTSTSGATKLWPPNTHSVFLS